MNYISDAHALLWHLYWPQRLGKAAQQVFSDVDAGQAVIVIIGIRDTVGFHGESVGELKDALQDAVDFYLESCEKAGREPNKPFSGKFVVRVDSSLHGEIAAAAVHAGKSLNKWVADTLKQIIHTH